MAYVITTICAGTCDTACVEVCPCDCIHGVRPIAELRKLAPAERGQLYIDPDECIDCDCCRAECPVSAIFPEDELPPEHVAAKLLNAEFVKKKFLQH